MKRIISFIIIATMIFPCFAYGSSKDATIDYLSKQELDGWGILALYLSGADISNKPIINPENSYITTDYEAYVMGAIPLGRDVTSITNKIKEAQRESGKFADYIDGTGEDLVNAHIWGIISLYAAGVEDYDKEGALKWLKEHQNEDGGFPIFTGDNRSDIDLTAMAIIAYAILGMDEKSEEIKKSVEFVEENLKVLESCEALSWYIISRVHFGLDVDPELYNMLQEYKLKDGGFKHLRMMSRPNYMATWHGLLAEDAYRTRVSIVKKLNKLSKFKDLDEGTYGYKEIMELIDRNIVSGYPDNTFKPYNSVKRSEFAKFVVYGLGLEKEIKDKITAFKDLEKDHWANEFVKVAVDKGLMEGLGEGLFAPDNKITGAQVAAILVRGMGLEYKAKEIQGTNWYDGYVKVARDYNLLYDDFQPNEQATRAQCAVAIYRLLENRK